MTDLIDRADSGEIFPPSVWDTEVLPAPEDPTRDLTHSTANLRRPAAHPELEHDTGELPLTGPTGAERAVAARAIPPRPGQPQPHPPTGPTNPPPGPPPPVHAEGGPVYTGRHFRLDDGETLLVRTDEKPPPTMPTPPPPKPSVVARWGWWIATAALAFSCGAAGGGAVLVWAVTR